MKIAYTILVITCAAWALPTENGKPLFKRIYINPIGPQPIPIGERIVNGHETVPHSIPYQAYIIITGKTRSWLCGGVLISNKFVLTAGHCLQDGDSALVYLGAHDVEYKEETQIRVTSSRLIVHEEFDEYTASNDIGLIQLAESVLLNEYIDVAKLPHEEDEGAIYKGMNTRISGWGFTCGSGSKTTSPVLLEANATVIENRLCNAFYGIVKDSQLCTGGEEGVSSCGGDSGGPLVSDNKVIGLVSYSVTNCVVGYPSGYTKISSYLEWIQNNTDVVVLN